MFIVIETTTMASSSTEGRSKIDGTAAIDGSDTLQLDAMALSRANVEAKPALNFPPGRLYGRSDELRALSSALGRLRRRASWQSGSSNDTHLECRGPEEGNPAEGSPVPTEEEFTGIVISDGDSNRTDLRGGEGGGSGDGNDTGGPEIILLSGHSGSGKSALAESLREPALGSGAASFFARGKFDKMRQLQPYSAFVNAFEEICHEILTLDDYGACAAAVRNSLWEATGDAWRLLGLLAPSLRTIMTSFSASGTGDDAERKGSRDSSYNTDANLIREFIEVCRAFLLAVTTGDCHSDGTSPRPAIIFLDDLQWADWPSLDMLVALASDATLAPFVLFVISFRSNEVDLAHPLTSRLETLERFNIQMTQIEVGGLSIDAINNLTADALGAPLDTTHELSGAVHKLTLGNVLFARQFLCCLVNEGLLWLAEDENTSENYGAKSDEESSCNGTPQDPCGNGGNPAVQCLVSRRRWSWDMHQIEKHPIPVSVVPLLTRRMLSLPQGVIHMLKLASCLGMKCEVSMLELLANDTGGCFGEALKPPAAAASGALVRANLSIAFHEGLLEQERQVGVDKNSWTGIVRFTHDHIQQAAYELISPKETAAWHLRAGQLLWGDNVPPEDLGDRLLFVVADQVNRGVSVPSTDDAAVPEVQKCQGPDRSSSDLARLNLKAATRAMETAAFWSASACAQA